MIGGKLTFKEFEENCRRITERIPAPVNEAPAVKAARIKKAKADYAFFFEYYLPNYATSKCGWFHIFIAKLLLSMPFIRLLLDWFRGCAKSVHSNVGYALWLMINGEMKCMLLVGENNDKACNLLSDIQAVLMSNARFIHDFGEQFSHGTWENGQFSTKDGVSFYALGIGQSPRGFRKAGMRPDYIVVDDVDSQELSNNPKRVRKLVDWVCDDLMGCFDGPRQRMIVVNNRPFVNSVIGSLINEKLATCVTIPISKIQRGIKAISAFLYQIGKDDKGKQTKWHRLMVNAVDANFNPSWPEKYTQEYWEDMRADKSYRSWMREYMNTPVVEGTVFKNDWIQWKQALPLEKYDYMICYCDPSWKGSAKSDHKAVAFIGKTGPEYHIIKMYNRVASIGEMVKYIYDLYESNPKIVCDWWIEAILNQDLHLEEFFREGQLRGYQLPIRPDYRAKPDKFSRIESLTPFYERGWLFHNSDERETPDMLRHIEHTLAFEQGSKTPDDSLDAEEGAIYYAQRQTRVSRFAPIVGGYRQNQGKW